MVSVEKMVRNEDLVRNEDHPTSYREPLNILNERMVGERRFELPASWSRTKRATKLRYSPDYQKTLCAER